MNKFIMGFIIGAIIAFPLGINFGKDVPLLSNPLATKPDISERVKKRAEDLVHDTKEAIHDATAPTHKDSSEHGRR